MSTWTRVKLNEIASSIDYGHTASSIYEAIGPKFLRITDIQDDSVNWESVPFCECSPTEEASLHLKSGDIVFARTGATTGKSFLIKDCPDRAVFASYLIRVRVKSTVLPDYLVHFFRTSDYWSQILLNARGAAQLGVNATSLKSLSIPLPLIAEQKRIAAILDKAEELRSLRRQALKELDAIVQSIFIEMFGNPLSNPNNFPIQKLGEICSHIIDCPHSTPTYATEITPYACVRSSDIQNGELVFSNVKYVELAEYKKRIGRGVPQQGDVIYCREGARFGNAALVTDDTPPICLGQRMMLFRPEVSKVRGEFIWGYLSSPVAYHQALREVGGSASPHINIRDIATFQIPVPPLSRQYEFAQFISAVNKLKNNHRKSLTQLDILFASLQHRAFRGEL